MVLDWKWDTFLADVIASAISGGMDDGKSGTRRLSTFVMEVARGLVNYRWLW